MSGAMVGVTIGVDAPLKIIISNFMPLPGISGGSIRESFHGFHGEHTNTELLLVFTTLLKQLFIGCN